MTLEDTIYDTVRRAIADELVALNYKPLFADDNPQTTWGDMKDAARWCNATLPQIRMWRFKFADFPASKIGRSIRINKAEFLAWLESRRPASAVDAVNDQLTILKAKAERKEARRAATNG